MNINLTSKQGGAGKTGNTDKTKVGGSSYPASGALYPYQIHNSLSLSGNQSRVNKQ